MENISLRAYNREIEQLIDNSLPQDALRHCQQILSIYPHCIETFRLIGKAHLELQEYEQAEETFQKVLSSIPDDFTANLGMSLLREKQNNLNGTIWHMERANEAQPSNTAVQTELRRLYQQRDGVETARIRLTRGALVRMYIRGDLIPQALNEIQAILLEDPSRVDIKILQSTAYLNSGKKDDALEKCREILQQLPYCYEANRILFENTPASTRIEEAQNYQQRLRELDPYYEFSTTTNPDPSKVPEDEVKISIPEGLNIQKTVETSETRLPIKSFDTFAKILPVEVPGTSPEIHNAFKSEQMNSFEEAQPDWMKGMEIATFQSDEPYQQPEILPEMSSTLEKEFKSDEPMTTEEPTPKTELPVQKENPADQVPESDLPATPFLTAAGQQIPVAEPGDIPEWLRALASEPPAASSDAITAPLRVPGETGVLQTGEENLDFLRNLPGEPLQSTTATPELPDIHQNLAVESLPGILSTDPFLVTNETTQPIPVEGDEEVPIEPTREVPEWLKSAVESTVEPPVIGNSKQNIVPEPPLEPEIKNVLSLDEYQFSTEQVASVQSDSQTENEIPTAEVEQYLEQLRKDVSPGEQPDWLKSENLGSDMEALFENDKKSTVPPPSTEATPSWMDDLKKDEVEEPQVSAPTSPISVPNVPDWLFTSETNEEDTAPIELEAPVTIQPTPDWLKEVAPDVVGFSESVESSDYSQVKPSDTVDQEQNDGLLQPQPVDFLQEDREPLEDNLDFSKAMPAESLPADLAALLREDSDKEIHTYPLEEDAPVVSAFNPFDVFSPSDFQSDQESENELPVAELPAQPEEMPAISEPQPEPEIQFDAIEPDLAPAEELSLEKEKETETDISAEEIKSFESVMDFEDVHPAGTISLVEDIQPFMDVEIPQIEVAQKTPDFQFIPEEQPTIQPIPAEEPVTLFMPEEQPVVQPIPAEKPIKQFIPAAKPVVQPIPEGKPVKQIIPEMKPVIIEKPAPPRPVKPIQSPEPKKPVRRIAKPKPVSQPIHKPSAGVADLAQAREAVARGDVIAALRRYIKLVNANKSLDQVSIDLKVLVRKNPKNYLAWQTYGDARLRSNRIQEALDAYAKAADLLK
ncbi:MAG: tetratricopeptide repeat protein [Leptolinea sp.]